ncbi:hypothetical protein Save01_08297 [Streptomyces avermitilis]
MTYQMRRTRSERLHQPEQRRLQREQRRLRVPGPAEQVRVGPHDLPQLSAQRRIQFRAHRVEGLGEHGETRVQIPSHAGSLRALPGEHEGRPALGDRTGHDVRRRLVGRQRGQSLAQLGRVLADDDGAVRQRGTGGRQREPDVERVRAVLCGEVSGQPFGLDPQGPLGAAGHEPGNGARPHAVVLLGRGRIQGLREHKMAVRAAHPERGHAGHPRLVAGPCAQLGGDLDAQLGERDVVRRGGEVQTRRDLAVLDGQGRLDEADDPRRSLRVPHVGLRRPHHQRPVPVGEDRGQRRRLHAVPHGGSGAVQLHVSDLGGPRPGVGEGRPQDVLLPRPARRGELLAAAVVVHRSAADHAHDVVAVRVGVRQGHEHDQAGALAAHVAVGAPVERVAAAVRRQRAELARGRRRLRREDQVDPARERPRRLPASHALVRLVHGNQGGGLCRVHDHARAGQSQEEGDPIREDTTLERGQGEAVDRSRALVAHQTGVVVPHRPEEDSGPAAPRRRRVDSRVFERFPREFQHQPLPWVHRRGLAGRHPEEARVEIRDAVEQTGPGHPGADVDGAVRGNPTDGLPAGREQLPVRLGRARARKAARQTDHRDDVLTTRFHEVLCHDSGISLCSREGWARPVPPLANLSSRQCDEGCRGHDPTRSPGWDLRLAALPARQRDRQSLGRGPTRRSLCGGISPCCDSRHSAA